MDRSLVAGAGIVLFLAVGIAAASTIPADSGVAYQSGSDLTLTINQDHQIEDGGPFDGNGGVEFNNVTFSSDAGSAAADVDQIDNSGFTNVSSVDASGEVNISRPDANYTVLTGDVTSARVTAINVSKQGNVDLQTTAASASVIEARTGQGVIAVDLATGNAIDEASPDATGEVAFEVPDGTTQVDLRTGPETLAVRSVNEPQQTVDSNVTTNATFFERDTNRVFVRESSDGLVDFAGLPKTSPFVVRVNATGFVTRRVLLDSIFEQDSVYLLNESADTVDVSFSIDDQTGRFGDQSTLTIERAINVSGTDPDERRYVPVAGAEIGEAREFTTELERDVRYRLTISNREGRERQLGAIVPTRNRAYNLVVTGLDFAPSEEGTTGVVETGRTVNNGTKTVTFRYRDAENETTDLRGVIHVRGNESREVATFQASPNTLPLGTFKFETSVSGDLVDETLVVDYRFVRNDETVSGVEAFGTNQFDITDNFPLDPGWGAIFGIGFLIVIAGAFSVGNARIGALILPGLALLLWQLGFISAQVSLLGIAVAFSIAVAYNVVQATEGGPA